MEISLIQVDHSKQITLLLLPFNWTSKRLKGNQRFCTLKAGYINVGLKNMSCQIMFVILVTQIVIILHLRSLLLLNMPI